MSEEDHGTYARDQQTKELLAEEKAKYKKTLKDQVALVKQQHTLEKAELQKKFDREKDTGPTSIFTCHLCGSKVIGKMGTVCPCTKNNKEIVVKGVDP